MKIYKISQNFQYLPQNPTGEVDPEISKQNMLAANDSLNVIENIVQAASSVNLAIDGLIDAVGIGDFGLKKIISNELNKALSKNNAVELLMRMTLISKPEDLFNSTMLNKIKTDITNNINNLNNQQNTEKK